MPTYEYACTACGHRLEAVQSFTDDPLTSCPACRGSLRKVYGAVGIVLKGSGFYKNDSRPARSTEGQKANADSSGDRSAGTGDTSQSATSASADAAKKADAPGKTDSPKTDSPKRDSRGSSGGTSGSSGREAAAASH